MKRKNLKKFRIDLDLKSKDMAEKLGVSTSYYSNFENGKVEPSIEFAYKFQEVFGVDDVMELFKKENK